MGAADFGHRLSHRGHAQIVQRDDRPARQQRQVIGNVRHHAARRMVAIDMQIIDRDTDGSEEPGGVLRQHPQDRHVGPGGLQVVLRRQPAAGLHRMPKTEVRQIGVDQVGLGVGEVQILLRLSQQAWHEPASGPDAHRYLRPDHRRQRIIEGACPEVIFKCPMTIGKDGGAQLFAQLLV